MPRAVASHLLVGVLTTLLGVLKIKHKMFGCTHPTPPTPLKGAFNGQVENLTRTRFAQDESSILGRRRYLYF